MIGLDIGTKYIKISYLEKIDNVYQLVASVIGSNPTESIHSKDDGKISTFIKNIFKDTRFPKELVSTSIGGTQIIIRNFVLPKLSENELKSAVMVEAEQSIFTDINNIDKDFQILDNLEDDKLDILFVGIPKEITNYFYKIIKDSNLDLVIMDIDNLAFVNCYLMFEPSAKEQSIVLLNIGHTQTNIVVLENGKLRFIRNVNFGGKNITLELANYLETDFEKADYIKEHNELWKDIGLNIKTVLRKSAPDLLEAIYRSIEYCKGKKMLNNIDEIIITGGTANLLGIDDFISEILDINTEKWNPLHYIQTKGQTKKEFGYFLPISLGLALREIKDV